MVAEKRRKIKSYQWIGLEPGVSTDSMGTSSFRFTTEDQGTALFKTFGNRPFAVFNIVCCRVIIKHYQIVLEIFITSGMVVE